MDPVEVSVIIPTYRRERELLEAIDSVLIQHGVAFEVIVLDDSPEGSARDAVESVSDQRVRYLSRTVPSMGRPAMVRNEGAKLARGRYLYFLDDDDMLVPDTLAQLSKALDAAPSASMAFGVVSPFGADEKILRHNQKYFAEARRLALRLKGSRQFSACQTFKTAILVCSAGMARRTSFEEIGGFDAEIPICEDAEFWARIADGRGHVFLDRVVVRYRTGAPSLMHNLVENDTRIETSWRRIQTKYREAHGALMFFAMKIWVRIFLR